MAHSTTSSPIQVENAAIGRSLVEQSLSRFESWLQSNGYSSFDPYDLWGTRYGIWSRRLYYKHGNIAAPLIIPVLLSEILCPKASRSFLKPNRYATADAQIILAYLNLYETRDDSEYLKKAEALAEELLGYATKGYSGYCWGYPFDWQNNKAMWPKTTPYITCTPYCYEAFLKLFASTGNEAYFDIAKSIAKFIQNDLNDTPFSSNSTAGSYSPLDNSMVVNASAYRAYTLLDAGKRFDNSQYLDTGYSNLEFILQCQNEDGSWLYGLDTPADRFIDHFHTCFVLKNLYKIYTLDPADRIKNAIESGFSYYRTNLFDEKGRPRSFAKEPRFQINRVELYNYAEAITLCALIEDLAPDASPICRSVAKILIDEYQQEKGYYTTRAYRFGLKHNFPFIRWPQAQIYLALTNLLKVL